MHVLNFLSACFLYQIGVINLYGESFQGYLIKFTKTNTIFPNEYLQEKTYKITPNQRTEKKAWRDSLNDLHRITSPNHKSKIVFNTTELKLSELREIMEILNNAFSNKTQRKVSVRYWNAEDCAYETAKFYIPDIIYTISNISTSSINYEPLEITMIEY